MTLRGQAIYVTGTKKVHSIAQLVAQNGGTFYSFPLIEVQEKVSLQDEVYLQKFHDYKWLIFTSQNAVHFFHQKLQHANITVDSLTIKIAAVGTKTAQLLKEYQFSVDFIPTIFSADVFVKEFPKIASDTKALFIKGNLAKATIRNHVHCDEWTVYDTVETTKYVQPFIASLQQEEQKPVVIFASPSAVRAYAQYIVPFIPWHAITVASIGHVTTAALQHLNASVHIQPSTYTMQAVIEQLISGGKEK